MAEQQEKKRGLFGRRREKPAGGQPGRIAQMRQVLTLTRRHYPAVPWLMAAALIGVTIIGVVVGSLLGGIASMIIWGILGLMGGMLLALFILGRFAERAAFTEMKGKPGAIGAVVNSARRGWLMDEQPITVDPRTQDMVFRTTGRGGVVLVGEGKSRPHVDKMLAKEKKRHERVLPQVPVHTFQGGDKEGQVPMDQITNRLYKLPKKLNKAEILAVRNRLGALGTFTTKPPIPKGIDPMRARPDRKAMRGR